jgi:hypothetical protein
MRIPASGKIGTRSTTNTYQPPTENNQKYIVIIGAVRTVWVKKHFDFIVRIMFLAA